MATTSVTYTVNSGHVSTPEFSYAAITMLNSSLLPEADQLIVKRNGTTLTITTDYTVDSDNDKVTLIPTLTVGDIIYIERDTDVDDALITFANNALLEKDDLNTANTQLLHALQEIKNQTLNTIRLDTSVLPNCWDGDGKRACNFANATQSTDLPTLGQVTALISGGDPMEVGDGIYDEQSGDGSETVFTLTDFPTTDVNAEKLLVHIDGVKQRPTADYTYALNSSSVPTVTFTTPPPTGTNNIGFTSIPGVVTTTYAAASLDGSVIIDNTLDGASLEDGTVDGDALVDNSVDVDKLDAGSGVANRFIVFNTDGEGTAQVATFSNLTATGPSTRTDISTTDDPDTLKGSFGSGTVTYTNDGSNTEFVTFTVQSQNGGGSCTITQDGESAITFGQFGGSGSANTRTHFSVFLEPDAELNIVGSSGTNNLLTFTVQEV